MASMHDEPRHRPGHHQRLNPDPIRTSSHLAGCGEYHSYRHLHHQRGTVGTFHVRLLEGRGLCRRHWSALSLGPVKHLGLSKAHGEVSSFGTFRLAFWRGDNEGSSNEDDYAGTGSSSSFDDSQANSKSAAFIRNQRSTVSSTVSTASSSEASLASQARRDSAPAALARQPPGNNFMPSMPAREQQGNSSNFDVSGKSPITPLFDQGSLRAMSPARSPFFPSYAQQQQPQQQPSNDQAQSTTSSNVAGSTGDSTNVDWDEKKPPASSTPTKPSHKELPIPNSSAAPCHPSFGPSPPHHYARDSFKSSTVPNDSNPIWGDHASSFIGNSNHSDDENQCRGAFRVPLKKDDMLPSLRSDGARIGLEVRLDEEMASAESLLVGGALSTAVGAAAAATSVVGMGRHTQNVSNMGMEMLGLSTDRLIGRGYVDLSPLLLGLWEECWEQNRDDENEVSSGAVGKESDRDDQGDSVLNEYGKINPGSRRMRIRVERMGMLDVWVPLYHPNSAPAASKASSRDNNSSTVETSGKVHLLISYEPNGMAPRRDDVVAFESFARRPLQQNGPTSPMTGPVITPIVPPLSPLLVVESRGAYLLLEHITSRTVTSVDRSGNVKSSRYDRSHRVRVHRNAVFVIERRTFTDAVANVARLPGDIVLSTPIGQEIADVSAPIVAGAMELMGPALLWGKLMMAAGGTGVRAGLAGARAATEAVVTASQEKALERRGGGSGYDDRGDSGVYGYGP